MCSWFQKYLMSSNQISRSVGNPGWSKTDSAESVGSVPCLCFPYFTGKPKEALSKPRRSSTAIPPWTHQISSKPIGQISFETVSLAFKAVKLSITFPALDSSTFEPIRSYRFGSSGPWLCPPPTTPFGHHHGHGSRHVPPAAEEGRGGYRHCS